MLFPVAVLVVIVLAAIAVDSAITFLAQREVADAAVAAANDAASEGVGNRTFYEGGRVDLDPETVEELVVQRVKASLDPDRFHGLAVDVVVAPSDAGCPPRVRVHASARVSTLFAAALPGGPDERTVEATTEASPAQLDQPGCS